MSMHELGQYMFAGRTIPCSVRRAPPFANTPGYSCQANGIERNKRVAPNARRSCLPGRLQQKSTATKAYATQRHVDARENARILMSASRHLILNPAQLQATLRYGLPHSGVSVLEGSSCSFYHSIRLCDFLFVARNKRKVGCRINPGQGAKTQCVQRKCTVCFRFNSSRGSKANVRSF